MYPNKFRDRNSRDECSNRWKDRNTPHGDTQRDSYHKFGGDAGHTSAERPRGSKDYSDSAQRQYYKEPPGRERSWNSPTRRRPSSPEWSLSEKRQRRYRGDEDDDFRYKYKPEDTAYKYAPDDPLRSHASKAFRHTKPPEDDFSYRKQSQDSRPRPQPEDSAYRGDTEDSSYKRSHYTERDAQGGSDDFSAERRQSQEFPTKSFAKARERRYSPPPHEELPLRTGLPMNGSRGEVCGPNHGPSVPGPTTKGFQRFLEVLNKGVDMSTLKKFAQAESTSADGRPRSPAASDQPCSPRWPQKRGSPEKGGSWSRSKGAHGEAAPPQARSPGEDTSHLRSEAGGSHFSSNSRSRSPLEAEKPAVTPEEEHKRKQAQDVLHAIGMDLGFEELGQMSNRIQERLYGKRDAERGQRRRDHKERNARPSFSPARGRRSSSSASSSSRSNFTPVKRGGSPRKDSQRAERDAAKEEDGARYDYAAPPQDGGGGENHVPESCVSSHSYSVAPAYPTYSMSQQVPSPSIPAYPQLHYPAYSYPPLPPLSWAPYGSSPLLPPLYQYPPGQPLNIHPALLPHTAHPLQPPMGNHQPVFLNAQESNKQKSKAQSRPRCLQVIDTK